MKLGKHKNNQHNSHTKYYRIILKYWCIISKRPSAYCYSMLCIPGPFSLQKNWWYVRYIILTMHICQGLIIFM